MTTAIVFTFIGADKPGLVETLSNTVSEHHGNWLESRMSQLAGHFAGIARIQIASDHADALRQALLSLDSEELRINMQEIYPSNSEEKFRQLSLNLVGNDRPGIVKELSSALAALHINVCEMNTRVTSAPMTAEALFEAIADIQVPQNLDLNSLNDKLDDIANELDLDIKLEN